MVQIAEQMKCIFNGEIIKMHDFGRLFIVLNYIVFSAHLVL